MKENKFLLMLLFLIATLGLAACESDEYEDSSTFLSVSSVYHNSVSLIINPFETSFYCEVLNSNTGELKTVETTEPQTVEFKDLTPQTNYQFEASYYNSSKEVIKKARLRVETDKYKGPIVKISLSSVSPESLSIKYEIEDDASYFYCAKGETVSSSDVKYTKTKTVSYYNLKPNTKYKFSAVAYDTDGNSAGPVTAEFKTASIPYSNYVNIDGTYVELYTAEMSTDREYSGTGTGTNWKYLKLHGPEIKNCVTQVVFFYVVPEWEGINNYWPDGKYYIDGNASGYYRYGAYVLYRGEMYKGDAELKISSNGSVQTFDFEIEDYCTIKGHFVGK